MGRKKKVNPPDELIDGIPLKTINRWRNLRGTWYNFNCSSKGEFDLAAVEDNEIAAFIKASKVKSEIKELLKEDKEAARWAAEGYQRQRQEERQSDKAQGLARYDQQVKDKLESYLDDFDAPTQADLDNLKALVEMQVRLADIQNTKKFFMASPMSKKTDKMTLDRFKKLADEETALLQQIRLWQTQMGIDKPTRDKKAMETTGVDEVRRIVQEAKAFLENEIREIEHCGIRLLWLWAGFPEESLLIRTRCPRCEMPVEFLYEEKMCPECGAELIRETGVIRCSECTWRVDVHCAS